MMEFLKRLNASWTAPEIVRAVQKDALTYLETVALNELFHAVRRCDELGLDGILVEAGCAAGGSAIVMAAAKKPGRKFQVYDVFGQIPAPSNKDGDDVQKRYEIIRRGEAKGIGDRAYYGYEEDLYAKVGENFARHGYPLAANNVALVKGLFQDTMVITEPVALAHLDGDWYDSVMTCLQRLAPRLVPGGRLVIDDYYAWSGCKKAVDEYFSGKSAEFDFVRKSRLHIVRK
jgi:asparagine synthase (glutamine-hydrolysing)